MKKLTKKIIHIPFWSNTKITYDSSLSLLKLTSNLGSNAIFIPQYIDCSSDNSKIVLKISSSIYIPILNSLTSIIRSALLDLHLLYTVIIHVKGVNFRFSLSTEKLTLFLNKSTPLELLIPTNISVTSNNINKDILLISGSNRNLVLNFSHALRKICPPNSYNGNGLSFDNETLVLKTGKKK